MKKEAQGCCASFFQGGMNVGREQLGPYALEQEEGVFPLGMDALALGEFVTLRPKWKVCDLGTGSGALLLMMARRAEGLGLYGVEREEAAARLARRNLDGNALEGVIWQGDWQDAPFEPGSFQLVVSNPPYFPRSSGAWGGDSRMESGDGLEGLCRCAARLVKNGGRFALCHRPDRLTDLMIALRSCGLEPKRMQMIAHTPAHSPAVVLVEAVRQGKPGLAVLPTRFVQERSTL